MPLLKDQRSTPLTTPLWRGLNEKDFCIGYQRAFA